MCVSKMYLGLVPSSNESGKADDRKGHITRQGPGRVRSVLCQAAWSYVRFDPDAAERYQRIVARNPKKKKIATVAMMRELAVLMWHRGREALADAQSLSGGNAQQAAEPAKA